MEFDLAIADEQKLVCAAHNAAFYPTPANLKVGISLNVKDRVEPINGLRHPPQGETSGWYIWAGEDLSKAPDFFKPLHAEHLQERCPAVLKFLALPPGWRFLIAEGHEDVWFDATLLELTERN